jgi:hypothetical protein
VYGPILEYHISDILPITDILLVPYCLIGACTAPTTLRVAVGESEMSRKAKCRASEKFLSIFIVKPSNSNANFSYNRYNIARISSLLQNYDIQKLPNRDRIQLALQFLHDNPTESTSVATKIYHVKEDSVRTARRREQKRAARPKAQREG